MQFGKRRPRKGAIAIMSAVLALVVISVAAIVIDIGYIFLTKTQLQATCDSACLAAGTELSSGLGVAAIKTPAEVDLAGRAAGVDFASKNYAGDKISVFASSPRDFRFGRASFDAASGSWIRAWDAVPYNMVRARLHRDQDGSSNGDEPLNLLLAPIMGTESTNLAVYATCVIMPASGFEVPPGSDQRALVLPFAFRRTVWERRELAQEFSDNNPGVSLSDNPYVYQEDEFGNRVLDDGGNPVQDIFDNFSYTEANGEYRIHNSPDGMLEVDLYPEDPGASGNTAGNSGTIDFGNSNNATSDIDRQIREGLNEADLAHFEDGRIVFDEDTPELDVEGDTGISGGPIDRAMNDILGEPRALALFTEVQNPGDNAIYTLVEFVGVRVMYSKLTGDNKHIWIQPATLVDGNAVPDLDDPPGDNDSIFTSLILID